MAADELHIDVLGPVERGCVLVVRSDFTAHSPAAADHVRAQIAAQIGHDQFGILFAPTELDVELIGPDDQVAAGVVYVGTPGACPQCGGDDVVIQTGESLVRSCQRCGHRWSQFHPGQAA